MLRGGAEGTSQVRVVGGAGEDHPANAKRHNGLCACFGSAFSRQRRAKDMHHATNEVCIGLLRLEAGARYVSRQGIERTVRVDVVEHLVAEIQVDQLTCQLTCISDLRRGFFTANGLQVA
jgi:hypothetical protein